MKLVALSLIALSSYALAEDKYTAWLHEQPFQAPSAGLYEIVLPHDTLNASNRTLKDIRLISPTGAEAPYFLDRTKQPTPGKQAAADFKASIVDNTTVLTARTQTDQAISAITLQTPSSDFIKSATVETRLPDGDWVSAAQNQVVFRYKNGVDRLTLPISGKGFLEIRVTLDDQRSSPTPFTGMSLTVQGIKFPTTSHTASLMERKEINETTRTNIHLGVKNLHLSKLHLDVADPIFSRRYTLFYWDTSNPKQPRKVVVSDGSIFAVNINEGSSTKKTSLPVNELIPTDTLVLEIENNSNPPLEINKQVKADSFATKLIFHTAQTGNWKLITGYPDATAPVYDLVALSAHLSKETKALELGPIRANPDYVKPDALPDINPEGAYINLDNWAYRRPIEAPKSGLIQLHIDPATLALSRNDLADIRVIQDGKQLPYLINPNAMAETIPTQIEIIQDPSAPNISKWKVTHNHDQLPTSKVIITPGTLIFERWIELISEQEDQFGKTTEVTQAQHNWVMKLRENEDSRLHLPLSNQRLPSTFYLVTRNGDNPPINITAVDVVCAKPSITFKRISSKPVFLYYGNPKASQPNYDLMLIRNELASVVKQPGLTGNKETIISRPSEKSPINTGSPWLWIALGLVVMTLLIVISKLLPAQAEDTES